MASAQPARYVTWTKEEEATLLNELASAMTIEEIAKQHSRTIGAINARQNRIGQKMVEEGVSIEEAARRVRQSTHLLHAAVEAPKRVVAKTVIPPVKEDTLLSVMIDIRGLMRQMVANQNKIIRDMNT